MTDLTNADLDAIAETLTAAKAGDAVAQYALSRLDVDGLIALARLGLIASERQPLFHPDYEHYYSASSINLRLTMTKQLFADAGHPNPTAIIDIFEQAKLAPDPLALPLSVAMREARRRTENGEEMWVWVHMPDENCAEKGDRFLLRYLTGVFMPHWQYSEYLESGTPTWLEPGRFYLELADHAVCRLVTPEDGMALLRGGE